MDTQDYSIDARDWKSAVDLIREYGFVVIRQIVPHDILHRLRERMDRDTKTLLKYCESIGGNPREKGHLQQGPPLTPDYVFREVAMNQYVERIAVNLFGGTPKLTFYNGNTNCPESTKQAIHMDGRHETSFPADPSPTRSVVVNVCPSDADETNGAVELWPGTHMVRPAIDDFRIPPEQERERKSVQPPISANTRIGDLLIRDVRVWHRGVPNPSKKPRHMIALIVSSARAAGTHKLKFVQGCEAALENGLIDSNAEYVGESPDYLLGPTRRIYEAKSSR